MNINKLYLAFVFLFLIGIVSASNPTIGTQQQNAPVELKQTCVINGTFCDSCNISSVDYPNSSIAISDVGMIKRNGDFYYNLSSNFTNPLGVYRVNGFCDYGSDVRKTWVYHFEISPTGHKMDSSKSMISIIGIAVMIIVFFLFLGLATIFLHPGTRIFFLGLALTTIVFIVGYVLKIQQETVGEFISFTSTFASFYTLLTILLIGGSIALMLWVIVFAFKAFNATRGYYD